MRNENENEKYIKVSITPMDLLMVVLVDLIKVT